MSYNYVGWAITPKIYLAAGVEENFPTPDINSFDADFMAQVLDLYTYPATTPQEQVNKFDRDIQAGSKMAYRFREGIERFFITDINARAQGFRARIPRPRPWRRANSP